MRNRININWRNQYKKKNNIKPRKYIHDTVDRQNVNVSKMIDKKLMLVSNDSKNVNVS